MLKCDVCSDENVYKLKSVGDGIWACGKCTGSPLSKRNYGDIVKIKVGKQWATQRQLDELKRRRILPYKKEGGGYYLGRMSESGKIEERWPDYKS